MRHNKNSAWSKGMYISLALYVLSVGDVSADTSGPNGTNDAKVQTAVRRDPFWPVGYMPEYVTEEMIDPNASAQAQAGSGWDAAQKQVDINGVSSRADNQFCAVINGQLMEVGDTLSVNYKGMIYTWEVEDIAASGSVKLRRVSASSTR